MENNESKVLKLIFRTDRILMLQKKGSLYGEDKDIVDFFLLECKAKDLQEKNLSVLRMRKLTGERAGFVFDVLNEWGEDFYSFNGPALHIRLDNYFGLFGQSELDVTFAKRVFGERVELCDLNSLKEELTSALNNPDESLVNLVEEDDNER